MLQRRSRTRQHVRDAAYLLTCVRLQSDLLCPRICKNFNPIKVPVENKTLHLIFFKSGPMGTIIRKCNKSMLKYDTQEETGNMNKKGPTVPHVRSADDDVSRCSPSWPLIVTELKSPTLLTSSIPEITICTRPPALGVLHPLSGKSFRYTSLRKDP